jgi:hypothetical protein
LLSLKRGAQAPEEIASMTHKTAEPKGLKPRGIVCPTCGTRDCNRLLLVEHGYDRYHHLTVIDDDDTSTWAAEDYDFSEGGDGEYAILCLACGHEFQDTGWVPVGLGLEEGSPMSRRPTLVNVLPLGDHGRRRFTYQQILKSCGKSTCGTCRGDTPRHGPYWQRIEWDEQGKKVRCRYVGKELPEDGQEALLLRRLLDDPAYRRLIQQTDDLVETLRRREHEVAHLRQRVANLEADLINVRARGATRAGGARLDKAARLYRKLALKYHPDRNPAAAEIMRDLNQLWQAVTTR